MSCPHCHPKPKGPFRFRVLGHFRGEPDLKELGSATTHVKAKELLEALAKWPAVDASSLWIKDYEQTPPAP